MTDTTIPSRDTLVEIYRRMALIKLKKEAALSRDPVPTFRAWLIQKEQASEIQLAAMESEIEREIDAAVDFALSSPEPDLAELRRDIFATEVRA